MFRSSTSSSSRDPGPLSLITRLLVFFSPLLLAAACCEAVLWASGETVTVAGAIARQMDSRRPTLYGKKYFPENHKLYKYEMLKLKRPQLVALGSSRVLMIRDVMLAPLGDRFYNAGRLIKTIDDLKSYVRLLEKGALTVPRVAIIGADPWWFKAGASLAPEMDQEGSELALLRPAFHFSAVKEMIVDGSLFHWLRWALTPGQAGGSDGCAWRAIGFGAFSGRGFRADGSILHGAVRAEFLKNPSYVDRERPPVIERVRKRLVQFSPAAGVDEGRMRDFMSVLASLRGVGSEVVVFLPPFSSEVHRAALEREGVREWYRPYWEELPSLLAAQGFTFFGDPTPQRAGLSDLYMLDGFHPSDAFVALLVEDLVRRAGADSLLAQVDPAGIARLRRDKNTLPVSLPPCPPDPAAN